MIRQRDGSGRREPQGRQDLLHQPARGDRWSRGTPDRLRGVRVGLAGGKAVGRLLAGLKVSQITAHAHRRGLAAERVGKTGEHPQAPGNPCDPVLAVAVGQFHHGTGGWPIDASQVDRPSRGDHPGPLRVRVGNAAAPFQWAEVAPGVGAGINTHRILLTAKATS